MSLVGTISTSGCHLHISLADSEGHMIGGHLVDNDIIFTTAEVSLIVFSVGLKPKIRKNPQVLSFGTENFEQGSSQFRFQYESFRFQLIWSQNGTEMEPNQCKN